MHLESQNTNMHGQQLSVHAFMTDEMKEKTPWIAMHCHFISVFGVFIGVSLVPFSSCDL